MRRRPPGSQPRIGYIVELPTRSGFCYAQYTHEHPEFGSLIRVIARPYARRPDDLGTLAQEPDAFVTFFPLAAAVKRGIFSIVGRADVPDRARKFPLFKVAGSRDPSTGAVLDWWLWNGDREWRIGALPPEHRGLPPREAINDTLLITRLEEGWRPETDSDVTGAPEDSVAGRTSAHSDPRHFLVFASESAARDAARALQEAGIPSVLDDSDDEWRLTATPNMEIPEGRELLERIARRHGGDYDGWEARPTAPLPGAGARRTN